MSAKGARAVALDLASAFEHYPLCRWILGNSSRPEQERLRLFEILVSDVLVGKAEFVRASNYGAIAVWVRSDALPLMAGERGKKLYRLLRCELGPTAANRLLKLHLAMATHHPTTPHDYLFLLGVRPDFRRTGVGTQLMAQHLNESDRMNRGCFLETCEPANLAFYTALGFEIVDNYVIDRTSPATWAMWRNPGAMHGQFGSEY